MTDAAEYSDVEYVFEPHGSTIPPIGEYVEALWARRAFMVELARADLRARRSKTSLGAIWTILDPLFQAAIYYFLYSVLRADADRAAFLPLLIGNIFLFQLTSAAMSDGGASVRRSKGLMLNSTFPRALLPVTSVYKSLVEFVPMAVVFVVLFPLLGGELGMGVFALPLLFAIQLVMNVGIALFLSTALTLIPDANNFIQYVIRVLFFATPIIYPVTLLPDAARALVAWQPFFALFASYQTILGGGVPDPWMLLQAACWAAAILVVGTRTFLRHERELTMYL